MAVVSVRLRIDLRAVADASRELHRQADCAPHGARLDVHLPPNSLPGQTVAHVLAAERDDLAIVLHCTDASTLARWARALSTGDAK